MDFQEVKGKKAKDSVTGLEGKITGYTQYLHGVDLVLLEYLDQEKNIKSEWMAVSRINILS
ncbi:hypothetical protein [Dysgonomonas sp.]|uniref:hypothetical protein n=1 Tax=Dysgonomonas sp. TaxID=1891233 RepID=UPI0027B9DA02|nr:hypothetical protein [Dysgonomonas sp.]